MNAGSPRASRVVGTVTTTARHSSVPCFVATRRPRPRQSMAVTGHSRTTSSPRAALATTVPRPSLTGQLTSESSEAVKSTVDRFGRFTPIDQLMIASNSGRNSRSFGTTPEAATSCPARVAAAIASTARSQSASSRALSSAFTGSRPIS